MSTGIDFDRDLLKHYVRRKGWLPLCRAQQRHVRGDGSSGGSRRIRYFTFCAVNAIDVLMLDIARVIQPSTTGRFDNVVFFEKEKEDVAKIQRAVPGAIGYPGDFLNTILLDAGQEVVEDEDPSTEALAHITEEEDTSSTRTNQTARQMKANFIHCFPFDILNFDLEGYFFKPSDPIPGRVVRALRRVFTWQRRARQDASGRRVRVGNFALMFTTQVGPANLGKDYLTELEGCLRTNIEGNEALRLAFRNRTGRNDARVLRGEDFEQFFKLGMPKILASILSEEDWIVNPEGGITIYEFERDSTAGRYQILHLTMHVQRKNPPSDRRMPGMRLREMETAYNTVIEKLFVNQPIAVTQRRIRSLRGVLRDDLRRIVGKRRQYEAAQYGGRNQ